MAIPLAQGFRPFDRNNFDDRRALRARARAFFGVGMRAHKTKSALSIHKLWRASPFAEMMRLDVIAHPTANRQALLSLHPQETPRTSTAKQTAILNYAEGREGWTYISNGVNGTVFRSPCGEWVFKRARRNDGTRTFLEWCMWKQARGEGMKGMPELDFLADCGEGYVVGMRRYANTASAVLSTSSFDAGETVSQYDYMVALITAFEAECPGCHAGDLHGGNFMYDDRTDSYVLIDPTNGRYRPLGSWFDPESFTLH